MKVEMRRHWLVAAAVVVAGVAVWGLALGAWVQSGRWDGAVKVTGPGRVRALTDREMVTPGFQHVVWRVGVAGFEVRQVVHVLYRAEPTIHVGGPFHPGTMTGNGMVDETVVVPYWMIAGVAMGVVGWWGRGLRRQWVRMRRVAKGLCPACGYDLRATPGRCPECGAGGG